MTGHRGEASEQIYSLRPVSPISACLFFPSDSDYKSWVEGLLEWLVMIPHPSRGERSEIRWVHYLWKRQTAVNQDLLMLCFLEKCSFEMEIQRTVRQLNRDKSKDAWDISGPSWWEQHHTLRLKRRWRPRCTHMWGGLSAQAFGKVVNAQGRDVIRSRGGCLGSGGGGFSVLM